MEDKDENNKIKEKVIIELNNNKYRLLGYSDEGSYGEVHILEGIKDNQKYAIKILKEEKNSDLDINNFENEINRLKELTELKGNIYTPKVYGSGKIKLKKFKTERPAFVLDYAEQKRFIFICYKFS